MASPVYSAGAFGNLLSSVSLPALKTIGAYADLSTCIEGQINSLVVTGATAPSSVATISFYAVSANSSSIVMSSATSTTVTLGSTPASLGIYAGMKVGLQQTSGHGGLGEVATIASISGNVLTFSSLVQTYAASDFVYVLTQAPTFITQPSSATGTYANATPYSTKIFLGPAQWFAAIQNSDSTQAITVALTLDKITGFV